MVKFWSRNSKKCIPILQYYNWCMFELWQHNCNSSVNSITSLFFNFKTEYNKQSHWIFNVVWLTKAAKRERVYLIQIVMIKEECSIFPAAKFHKDGGVDRVHLTCTGSTTVFGWCVTNGDSNVSRKLTTKCVTKILTKFQPNSFNFIRY